jgi:predicted TIM-barrel fold metal-dependent hydrolase
MRIVDTHVHVACADTAVYPRRPTGVGSTWWTEPNGRAEAVFADARGAGVGHAVVVQAVGAYGYDCECAADSAASSMGFASLVTAIDMSSSMSTGPRDIRTVVGWRLFGVADGAPWLDDGRADSIWQLAAAQDVVLVATIFSDRIGALQAVVARHPGVVVALDHCAFPDMARDGERGLLTLADDPDIVLKVSSHVLAAWHRAGTLTQSFDRLVAAFGVQRMCWGSDHPQHQGLSYAQKLALAHTAAASLDDGQRAMFFGGTAARIGWDPAVTREARGAT